MVTCWDPELRLCVHVRARACGYVSTLIFMVRVCMCVRKRAFVCVRARVRLCMNSAVKRVHGCGQ